MRGLFSALVGGGKVSAAVSGLIQELGNAAGGNPAAALESCLRAGNSGDLVDALQKASFRNAVGALDPAGVVPLVADVVAAIEGVISKEAEGIGSKDMEFLANAIVLLTELLLVGQHLVDAIWLHDPSTVVPAPLNERLVNAAMQLLFLRNFAIEPKNTGKWELELVSGPDGLAVDPERLWYETPGIFGDYRVLGLKLLAALLCGEALTTMPDWGPGINAEITRTPSSAASAGTSNGNTSAVAPIIVEDARPLAYLCDAGRRVPYRAELLQSLVHCVCSYDPTGFGVPYGGLLAGAEEEEFTALSIQILGLLLQDPGEATASNNGSSDVYRPQEHVGNGREHRVSSIPDAATNGHFFRSVLGCLSSEKEVTFVFKALVSLLDCSSKESNGLLPYSFSKPQFLSQVVVLMFHLSYCDAFVKAMCKYGEVHLLAQGLLVAMLDTPQTVLGDGAALIAAASLVRLSAWRQFCSALNEESTDRPEVLSTIQKGTCANLIATAALKLVGDNLATAMTMPQSRMLLEAALNVLVNVSTFATGLNSDTCHRLFAVFERCSRTAIVKRGGAGASLWLPRMLEVFLNCVQYQYGSNLDLAYGIVTRAERFTSLRTVSQECLLGADASDSQDVTTVASVQLWREITTLLEPICGLLDVLVPELQADLDRKDITSPDEAKQLLPKSLLGLLQVPHAFTLRTMRYSVTTSQASERCLVHDLASGPHWKDAQASATPRGHKKWQVPAAAPPASTPPAPAAAPLEPSPPAPAASPASAGYSAAEPAPAPAAPPAPPFPEPPAAASASEPLAAASDSEPLAAASASEAPAPALPPTEPPAAASASEPPAAASASEVPALPPTEPPAVSSASDAVGAPVVDVSPGAAGMSLEQQLQAASASGVDVQSLLQQLLQQQQQQQELPEQGCGGAGSRDAAAAPLATIREAETPPPSPVNSRSGGI